MSLTGKMRSGPLASGCLWFGAISSWLMVAGEQPKVKATASDQSLSMPCVVTNI